MKKEEEKYPLVVPSVHTKIWRYMDFTKFVSMLETAGLFFSRADCLGDPFEGALPKIDRQLIEKNNAPHIVAASTEITQKIARPRVMLSCWHMNECESEAMWKLYTKTNEAISIQSTYGNLRACFGEEIVIEAVRYIDYETELMQERHPSRARFFHKRKSFEHEKELRAMFVYTDNTPPPSDGKLMKADLHQLVERIYVAPTSPPWFKDLVKAVVIRYGLDKPVEQSALDNEPMF